jgi:hypothetical protein
MAEGFKFGSKSEPKTLRGSVSFKEMTLREHLALQLMLAMIRSDNYHYTNDKVNFGEEKYAVDAFIAADAILELSGKSPDEIKGKIYDGIHEHDASDED